VTGSKKAIPILITGSTSSGSVASSLPDHSVDYRHYRNATMSGFEADKAIYATVVLFVFFIGFFGVRQGNIFSSPSPPTSTSPVAQEEVNVNEQKRYSRSGLRKTKPRLSASNLPDSWKRKNFT